MSHLILDNHVLVGRTQELNAWRRVLADPTPTGVVIVGAQGMGKSELLQGMLDATLKHPTLNAGAVLYEIVPSDSFEFVVRQMIEDAYTAARLPEDSLAHTSRRHIQWKALIGILPKGDKLHSLLQSLQDRSELNPRLQLLEQFKRISHALPESGRAVFLIDAEKDLSSNHADAWRLVVRDIPEKCKLVFSQRPAGALASNSDFMASANVVQIPPSSLGALERQDIHILTQQRANEIGVPQNDLLHAVDRYDRHPYAVTAALALICNNDDIDRLPADPTPEKISEHQWHAVCRKGPPAVKLFCALAVLAAHSPADVICDTAGISREDFAALVTDPQLAQFLTRSSGNHWTIYHSLLSDCITASGAVSLELYHRSAAAAYRKRLHESDTAATRLPHHCLAFGGLNGFSAAVIDVLPTLINAGLYTSAMEMVSAALKRPEDDQTRYVLIAACGHIYRRLGNIHEAEERLKEAVNGLDRLEDHVEKAVAQTGLAELAQLRGDDRESESLWRQAAKVLIDARVAQGAIQCILAIGGIRLARNDGNCSITPRD